MFDSRVPVVLLTGVQPLNDNIIRWAAALYRDLDCTERFTAPGQYQLRCVQQADYSRSAMFSLWQHCTYAEP